MARTDHISKSLGCRLTMLLFWMGLVCCAFYASRLSGKLSDISDDHLGNSAPSRQRRYTHTKLASTSGQCRMKSPTEADMERLKRLVVGGRRGKARKGLVHCSVVNSCVNNADNWQASCFSRDCTTFKVHTSLDPDTISVMDVRELATLVERLFVRHGAIEEDDVNRHLHVWCQDSELKDMTVLADGTFSPPCSGVSKKNRDSGLSHSVSKKDSAPDSDKDSARKNDGRSDSFVKPKKHIHVFYFRFLSDWEMPVRFPALTATLTDVARAGGVGLTLDKHQATMWEEEESLATLILGQRGRLSFNSSRTRAVKGKPSAASNGRAEGESTAVSLLNLLQESDYCLRLEDVACSASHKHDKFLDNLTSYGRVICSSPVLRHRETVMDRLCTAGNLTDARSRVHLTSLMSGVHGVDRRARAPRSALSISLLNTKDYRNPDVLDLALKNVIFSLLQGKNNMVVLLSGAGNPAFLRFDRSVGLQVQASNPVLKIYSSGGLSKTTLRQANLLNQTLFSMRSIHNFMKSFIDTEVGVDTARESDSGETALTNVSDISPDSLPLAAEPESVCSSLGVRAPFMCLCEDEYVHYENDTLTVGFAELGVSLINRKLREAMDASKLRGTNIGDCAPLDGVSFTNVHIGHIGDKTRMFMELVLNPDGFQNRVYRHAVLELWDMDKQPRSDVHFYRGDNLLGHIDSGDHSSKQDAVTRMTLNSEESETLLKTLCNSGTSFNSHVVSESVQLERLKQKKHFGRKPTVIHVHDSCLYLLVRDFGDSISVDASNLCGDRRYDVMLHLSLMNMMALTPLPFTASVTHAQTEFMTVVVKESYTVPTFAYKLHPDFTVTYK